MNPLRTSGACAIAVALALPVIALGASTNTTLRVEGGAAGTLPETAVTNDDTAGPTVVVKDSADVDTATVPWNSATAQIDAGLRRFGIPLAFSVDPAFGSFISRIGPDAGSLTSFWLYKVNHKAAQVGADAQLLTTGDSVLWYFTSDFTARELDLAPSGDKLPQGQPFTVTVRSYDNDGIAVPATGANVVYGDQSTTADATGKANFAATGLGVKLVSATRVGEVRSQARAVCSYTVDPTVCSLPAAPLPVASAAGATIGDTVAPGSVIASPVSGRRYQTLRTLRGSAGPDRSDISAVEVSVARRVGTLCRFMGRKGGFTAARSCVNRLFIPARSNGSRWLAQLPVALPAGKYRAWSRAVDGSGNRESVGISAVNAISFTILPKQSSR
jgi:hypothetical protein